MNKRNSSRRNSSLSKLSLVLNVNGLANSEFNITIKVTPSTQNKEEVVNIPSVTKTEEVLHTFSVSESKKVVFSKGNLQLHKETSNWRVAKNQYDVVAADDEWTDLVAFKDIPEEKGTYRLLTKDEWEYLLFTRQEAATKVVPAAVNGVPGFLLLPDNFTLPRGCKPPEGNTKNFSDNIYWDEQWCYMEDEGAVFLPAAGSRNNISNSILHNVGTHGYYWSSTVNGTLARLLYFTRRNATMYSNYRVYGISARFVEDVI